MNQGWGWFRPEVYSQFGFSRHNGLDHRAPNGTFYIHAPCNARVLDVFSQPTGGGNVLSLITEPITFDAFSCSTPDGVSISFLPGVFRVRIDFLHLDHAVVKRGDTITAGDLIAIGDNTGFSTGPHCHTQWRRVLEDGNYTHADTNDANNSFDPTQFFDGFYSVDYQTAVQKLQALVAVLKNLLGLLSIKK